MRSYSFRIKDSVLKFCLWYLHFIRSRLYVNMNVRVNIRCNRRRTRISRVRLISFFTGCKGLVEQFAAPHHNPRGFLSNYVWHELRLRLQLRPEARPRSSHYPGEWILFSQRLAPSGLLGLSKRKRSENEVSAEIRQRVPRYISADNAREEIRLLWRIPSVNTHPYLCRIVRYRRDSVESFIKNRPRTRSRSRRAFLFTIAQYFRASRGIYRPSLTWHSFDDPASLSPAVKVRETYLSLRARVFARVSMKTSPVFPTVRPQPERSELNRRTVVFPKLLSIRMKARERERETRLMSQQGTLNIVTR